MIYAFIDTNIFIRVMSQGKPGCEINLFDDLRTLTKNNAISLIIPEVVLFELESHMSDLEKKLRQEFGEIKKAINTTTVWSELQDSKQSILTKLDTDRDEKLKRWKTLYNEIMEFFETDDVKILPFTPEIMCRAKSRIIRGAMPRSTANQDQDAAIIESLAAFFEKCDDHEAFLLFCSENHTDFAVEHNINSQDRIFSLHPLIKSSLPDTKYFLQLTELLKIDQGYETLSEPDEIEDISNAVNKLNALKDDPEVYEFESDAWDEYMVELENLDQLINKHLSHDFSMKVFPKLPEDIQKKRKKVYDQIQQILRKCRACKSWSEDSSEYKLPQWLENVPEEMIQYTSLSKLFTIEKNLKRYLFIHKEMDDDLEG